MKVTQEKLPDSQLGLEIEIAAETSRSAYDKMVQNLARSSNVPGFRKGKVPRHILLQRIGVQRIKAAALEELIQKSLQDALEQESIDALGNYNLRSNFDELVEQYNPGDVLTFSVAVDIPPAPELPDYSNISVRAEEIAYDPKQVDDYLEQRRLQQADLIPVEERGAEMGDVAFVDFKGTLTVEGEAGEEIEGGSATNFQLELAEGKMIPGMVEGIVGMKPEETKDVAVTFPEDYPQEDLAGKPAVFTITLNELKTKELPELDDDFATDASNGEFETLDALKESLTEQFTEKAANKTKQNINNAILEVLVEQSQVELPDTMVQEEVTNVLTKTLMQMQQMGLDVRQLFTSDSVPRLRENARPEALENLKQELVLKAIAANEGLQPTSEEISAKMAEITQELQGQELDRDKLRKMVTKDLVAEKTFDWLREKAQIELVPEGSLSESEAAETEAESADPATESSSEAE
jgi:trigger factor